MFGLAACGESSTSTSTTTPQETATAEVCSARADIAAQIKKLEGLPVATSSITEAKKGLEAITADVHTIKNAQPELAAPRKEQVEAATAAFGQTLASVSSNAAKAVLLSGSGAGLSSAEAELKAALSELSKSYRQTLGPISCP